MLKYYQITMTENIYIEDYLEIIIVIVNNITKFTINIEFLSISFNNIT